MNSSDDYVEISQKSSLHNYRTEIPNILFEMDLDPYSFKTYCVLKKTAGDDGVCFKSIETLCKEIGISRRKFQRVKKELVAKGLILVQQSFTEDGGNYLDFITIADIWAITNSSEVTP